jgi:general secretion pathway protein J
MNSGRPCFPPSPWTTDGFTLLEIMVAIFIFAVVMTTIFGSFRAVLSSVDAVGGDVRLFASARICLDRMTRDLTGLHISDYPRYRKPEFNDDADPYRIEGDETDDAGSRFGRLRFASQSHLPIDRSGREGICRIVYYAQENDDETIVLRRADHLYPFPEFEENRNDPILCENLLGLEFTFFDDENEETDRWDSESADFEYATPRSIAIRLTIGQPERPKTFTTRVPLHVHRNASE